MGQNILTYFWMLCYGWSNNSPNSIRLPFSNLQSVLSQLCYERRASYVSITSCFSDKYLKWTIFKSEKNSTIVIWLIWTWYQVDIIWVTKWMSEGMIKSASVAVTMTPWYSSSLWKCIIYKNKRGYVYILLSMQMWVCI